MRGHRFEPRVGTGGEVWGATLRGSRDVPEMPDVELIVNLTIPAVHASVALQAIRSGKHVYGEKPFALSSKRETIIAAAAEHKVQLGNAPDTFLGGLQTARRVIEAGRIGTRSRQGHIWLSRPGRLASKSRVSFPEGWRTLLDMGPTTSLRSSSSLAR